jgi:hypothetical protein
MFLIVMVAREFWVLQVAGSNPAAPTKEIKGLSENSEPLASQKTGLGSKVACPKNW